MYKINKNNINILTAGDVIQSEMFGYIEIIISNNKEAGTLTAQGTASGTPNTLPYNAYNDENCFLYKGNINHIANMK
jgi:hypothetical protein